MTDSRTESELKIPVSDLEEIRSLLQRARAKTVHLAAREINLLLDTKEEELRTAGSLLRVRQYAGKNLLTFKGPATFRGAIKNRPEYETHVEDLDRTLEIFRQLGFGVFMKYEKDREEWQLDDVAVVLDHTPMGDFVEIEGPSENLEGIADLLGLKIGRAVRESYVSLWLDYRARHPALDLPSDMVFPE